MAKVKSIDASKHAANGDHIVSVTLDDGRVLTAQSAVSMWNPTPGLSNLMTELLNKALAPKA